MENNNEQYSFVLGALARIDKKVDIMSASLQEVKIDLIHVKEDIDEARADISELKQYNSLAILKHIDEDEEFREFEEEMER
jgi:hypothetical protein